MAGIVSASAALIAFVVTLLLGFIVIPYLRRLKFGQTILDIGPVWHKSKQGTPTMGGVMFIVGTLVALIGTYFGVLLMDRGDIFRTAGRFSFNNTTLWGGAAMALGFALIGFIDDYIKVVKKQNLGLTAFQKTVLQFLVAAGYLFSLALEGPDNTATWIPFVGRSVDLGIFFWPIALVTIYGFVNAVNLTDGVDGLASSVTMVVGLSFMFCAGFLRLYGLDIMAAALAGGCAGFLVWNFHPAKVFMGDTGSMFLGGMVCALAFGMGRPILLLLVGIIYIAEAMSVVIQVSYYKRTKKRIFKMSPIHHHFELSGWNEIKIVAVFTGLAVIGGGLAVLLVAGKV